MTTIIYKVSYFSKIDNLTLNSGDYISLFNNTSTYPPFRTYDIDIVPSISYDIENLTKDTFNMNYKFISRGKYKLIIKHYKLSEKIINIIVN